jgi:hypothetical protein
VEGGYDMRSIYPMFSGDGQGKTTGAAIQHPSRHLLGAAHVGPGVWAGLITILFLFIFPFFNFHFYFCIFKIIIFRNYNFKKPQYFQI